MHWLWGMLGGAAVGALCGWWGMRISAIDAEGSLFLLEHVAFFMAVAGGLLGGILGLASGILSRRSDVPGGRVLFFAAVAVTLVAVALQGTYEVKSARRARDNRQMLAEQEAAKAERLQRLVDRLGAFRYPGAAVEVDRMNKSVHMTTPHDLGRVLAYNEALPGVGPDGMTDRTPSGMPPAERFFEYEIKEFAGGAGEVHLAVSREKATGPVSILLLVW